MALAVMRLRHLGFRIRHLGISRSGHQSTRRFPIFPSCSHFTYVSMTLHTIPEIPATKIENWLKIGELAENWLKIGELVTNLFRLSALII